MVSNSQSEPKALTALLPPVEKVAINQQILARLKAFLDQEHLRVGSKLPSERQMATMLHVSRPSIREVLRALSILGIVKPKQGDGTYLASSVRKVLSRPEEILTLQERLDLVELAEARSAIEPTVASLTARRASESDLGTIGEHLEGMRKNVKNRDRFLYHDLQFHLSIMKACGNDVLKRMMSVVLETLFDHGAQVARNYGDLAKIQALHGNILGALRRRDPRAARAAMTRHMRVSRKENAQLNPQSEGVRRKNAKGTTALP